MTSFLVLFLKSSFSMISIYTTANSYFSSQNSVIERVFHFFIKYYLEHNIPFPTLINDCLDFFLTSNPAPYNVKLFSPQDSSDYLNIFVFSSITSSFLKKDKPLHPIGSISGTYCRCQKLVGLIDIVLVFQ